MGSPSIACSLIFTSILILVNAELPLISGHPPANSSIGPWKGFEQFAGCHKGEQVAGLAGLKQYLHRFGYIPDQIKNSNYSDSFDSELESALKTYQLNFNLNTTGTLDPQTVQQIIRPRCGVSDIINGTSSMNSGKPTSTSFHSVGHYSFFPGFPRWPTSKLALTYSFDTSNLVINIEDMRTVFSKAFARWSAVTPLTFTETSASSSDIKIGFFRGAHGDGEPFDGILGTLAHAFSPTDGRFHMDADENWVVDISSSSSPTAIDLESVAVHEIGHLLGLGHSSIESAIMFPTITSGTKRVVLDSDDINGIQVLYGGNPNSNVSSSTTDQNDTNGGGSRRRNGWFSLQLGCNFLIFFFFSFFLSL